MSHIVVLSPTATAGIIPLGLILLLNAGARSFHGVARFKTQYSVSAKFTTTHRGSAEFTTTYECEAIL